MTSQVQQKDVMAIRQKQKRRFVLTGIGLAAASFAVFLIALSSGAMNLSPGRTAAILWSKLSGTGPAFPGNEVAVVWDIRLPRILCGFFVGAGLAMGGVIFQALLRNPLADPYTLGVSTGAAFGASAALYASLAYGIFLPVSACAFLSAFLTLGAVIAIAGRGGGMLSSSLVISGIIVSSILSSGVSFLKMMAGENVSAIVFWLMGSLASRTWENVALVGTMTVLCGTAAIVFARDLDVMTLGDDAAQALGVDTGRTRLLYLILGACMTAACVAVSGVIAFVGLAVPHILRFWLTSKSRALLPLSALLGGLLLMLADHCTRMLSAGEIPVGVLTTLFGGPFFIFVFTRRPEGRGGHG